MTRRHADINNDHSTYIFYGIIPLCNFLYRNSVLCITLIPFMIISRNLVQMYSMTSHFAEIKNGHSTYSFCWIIPLFNFWHRNLVLSITLIPFKIISRNLVLITVWPDFDYELLLLIHFCGFMPLGNFLYSQYGNYIFLQNYSPL